VCLATSPLRRDCHLSIFAGELLVPVVRRHTNGAQVKAGYCKNPSNSQLGLMEKERGAWLLRTASFI